MTEKTRRESSNPMDNQAKNTEKILSIMTGSGAQFCPRY